MSYVLLREETVMADESAQELARIIANQPEGRDLGVVTKDELRNATGKRVKAVLFIPEGESIESDLEIQVVGAGTGIMTAIVARRC